jgi:hypothetical protein
MSHNPPGRPRDLDKRERVEAELDRDPDAPHAEIARRCRCSPQLVANLVRDRARRGRSDQRQKFATPTGWLDEPPARIKAQRKAEGIDP